MYFHYGLVLATDLRTELRISAQLGLTPSSIRLSDWWKIRIIGYKKQVKCISNWRAPWTC